MVGIDKGCADHPRQTVFPMINRGRQTSAPLPTQPLNAMIFPYLIDSQLQVLDDAYKLPFRENCKIILDIVLAPDISFPDFSRPFIPIWSQQTLPAASRPRRHQAPSKITLGAARSYLAAPHLFGGLLKKGGCRIELSQVGVKVEAQVGAQVLTPKHPIESWIFGVKLPKASPGSPEGHSWAPYARFEAEFGHLDGSRARRHGTRKLQEKH
ncbi:hypothetical protein B0H16DRAFT_1686625 [Mycena metata]|uniref:Uncharacterized protein n=1 Tax=Mycena metata TaxID=1033252 RepID=A0AAD7JPU7_9AGAR|nr:hypothetical protein B0H16DRAFT_1686625 [Mycena metata]